jgi:hypothetical protein
MTGSEGFICGHLWFLPLCLCVWFRFVPLCLVLVAEVPLAREDQGDVVLVGSLDDFLVPN